MSYNLFSIGQRRSYFAVALLILVLGSGISIASYSAALTFVLSSLLMWLLMFFGLRSSALLLCRRISLSFKKIRHLGSRYFSLICLIGLPLVLGFVLLTFVSVNRSSWPINSSGNPNDRYDFKLPPLDPPPSLPDLYSRIEDSESYLLQITPTTSNLQQLSVRESVSLNAYEICINELWRLLFEHQSGSISRREALSSLRSTLNDDEVLKQLQPQIKQEALQFLEESLSASRFRMPSAAFRPPSMLELTQDFLEQDFDRLQALRTVEPQIWDFLSQPATESNLYEAMYNFEDIESLWWENDLYAAADKLYEDIQESVDSIEESFHTSASNNRFLKQMNQSSSFLLLDRQISSIKKGLLLREATLEPLPASMNSFHCWRSSCPKTKLELSKMPRNSFYEAQEATDLEISDYGNISTITWEKESPEEEIKFVYLSPPYQNLRFILSPFLNFSYRSNWLVGFIGISTVLLLGIIVPIASAAAEELIQDGFKNRFQKLWNKFFLRKKNRRVLGRKRPPLASHKTSVAHKQKTSIGSEAQASAKKSK